MRSRSKLLIALAGLLMLTLTFAGTRAADALRAMPTAVGVVDLQQVFENLREQQQIRAELLGRQEELRRQGEQRRREIETLRGDLDLLQPGSPAHSAKQAEVEKAAIEFQVWGEIETRKLRIDEQLNVERVIRKANEAVERVGRERGFDLVLFKNQNINMQQGQQQAQIALRYVAWNSDALDLTDEVVQRMNNEFRAGAN